MVVLLLVAGAWAGAWVHAPGHGYTKLGASVFEGAAGSWRGLSGFAEVGLPAGFQLTLAAPVGVGTQVVGGIPYRRWAAGDGELGLSRRLLPAASVSVFVHVPLYGDAVLADRGSLAERYPDPGDGVVDVDLRVDAGHALRLGASDGWVQAGLGWRHRDGAPVDGVIGGAELGVGGPGFVLLRARAVVNVVADPDTREGLTLGVGAGVGVGVRVEGWIEDTRLATPAARGTGAGLGISWNW